MNVDESLQTLSDFEVTLTGKDREFMRSYYRLADMVADLIGPHCEVVLHSFEDLDVSVVKIVNGHHTGRGIGSPITDMGLKMLRLYLQTGEVNSKSYFTRNKNGELLKSTTSVLAGDGEKPIGLFCVNINLSVPFPELMKTLIPDNPPLTVVMEHFSTSSQDVIIQSTEKAINEVDRDSSISKKSRNKSIVFQLFENGIFELKESAAIVSERLGISRHAVYKYIREFKTTLTAKE